MGVDLIALLMANWDIALNIQNYSASSHPGIAAERPQTLGERARRDRRTVYHRTSRYRYHFIIAGGY